MAFMSRTGTGADMEITAIAQTLLLGLTTWGLYRLASVLKEST
jgi:hypothetical protein